MTDVFADGIRSIAVANGIVRVELVQLKRGGGANQLDPQVTGCLILPAAALKDFTLQFARTLERLEQRSKERGKRSDAIEDGGDNMDEALEHL